LLIAIEKILATYIFGRSDFLFLLILVQFRYSINHDMFIDLFQPHNLRLHCQILLPFQQILQLHKRRQILVRFILF